MSAALRALRQLRSASSAVEGHGAEELRDGEELERRRKAALSAASHSLAFALIPPVAAMAATEP